MNRPTSALSALSAAEKATVLDELLTARPDLQELAETRAAQLISTEDRATVAAAVTDALLSLDIMELNARAGYQPGRGYIHATEAAGEILDEALEPFMRDLERRATLDMTSAATELAMGILLGLYECRDSGSETLLEHSPHFAVERATHMAAQCTKLRITLPHEELLDLMPEWDGIMD